MKPNDISKRLDLIIEQSEAVLQTRHTIEYVPGEFVNSAKLAGLRASALSFIAMVYGNNHSHYLEFNNATDQTYYSNASSGHEILKSIKGEIDGGWIFTFKQIVASEIFADFMEMANHLLEQGYKDPAAVMIGSVLEENLRQICKINNIDVEYEKDGNLLPKKADRLNSDLCNAEIYSKLDQKSVTMWLDIRNKAAHGKYNEYNKEQVEIMAHGVIEFLTRNG